MLMPAPDATGGGERVLPSATEEAPTATKQPSRSGAPSTELSNKVGDEYKELLTRAQNLRSTYEEMNSHQKNLNKVFEQLQAAAIAVGTDRPAGGDVGPTQQKFGGLSSSKIASGAIPKSGPKTEPTQHSIFTREPAQIVTGVVGIILGVCAILGYSLTAEQVTALGQILTLLLPLILTYAGGLAIRQTVTKREAIDQQP